MKNQHIEILPLGGLYKIGSNICLFKIGNTTIAIDAGIKFPDSEYFDLNYSMPNLDLITKIDYIIITHGHEDHIGGISKVIQKFPNAIILTTRFNDYLVIEKLKKDNLTCKLEVVEENVPYVIQKDVSLQFIHVNHSIPFTKGVHLETRDCSILFISDFKIEENEIYEKKFDLNSLKKLGAFKKYRIAMLDSTNILTNKRTFNEKDVQENLEQLIGTVNKKIFITTFASNLYRIIEVIKLCKKFKKKLIIKSPAMNRFVDIGLKHQLIDEKSLNSVLINNERKIPKNAVILLSGSQGEKRSTLRNLLQNSKPIIKIEEGDVICFSSKIIPGNEKSVFNIYDDITKKGGVIVNDRDGFHSSGHADQNDLEKVYQHYSPNYAIPIHGSVYFLNAHLEFIQNNFPDIKSIGLLNSDRLIIDKDIKIIPKKDQQQDDYTYYFGNKSLEITNEFINERKKMAEKGLVSIVIQKKSKKMLTKSIETLGLPCSDETTEQLSEIIDCSQIEGSNEEQQLREIINKYFEQHLGCRPKSLIHFI